jgi:mannose-1-phosphate guanylyltransferase
MRVVLLAAGLGTRLLPLTNHLPKCLVPINGRPLIDYWLENLVNFGVSEILINTHYFSSLVVEFIRNSAWASYVTFVHEDNLLGTGGTILKNRAFFQEQAFLVAHADNLTIFNLNEFCERHDCRPAYAELTMMVFRSTDPQSCGIVELDEYGVVKAFHEKIINPPSNLANGAVYILEPSVVEFMSTLSKREIDFSTEVIPSMIGKIYTFCNSSYHRDIGTITSWAEANIEFPIMNTTSNIRKWATFYEKQDKELLRTVEQLLVEAKQKIQK